MQNGNANLKIYTVIKPDDESQQEQVQRTRMRLNARKMGVFRRVNKQAAKAKPAAQASEPASKPKAELNTPEKAAPEVVEAKPGPRVYSAAQAARHKPIAQKNKPRMGATEKLMRNSAIACALLLTVLAMQNVNQPWTQTTLGKLKQAVTMRIDLDESLGRLNFVRGLVPDSAQVFWSMGAQQLKLPVIGTIAHEYADMQPWVEFVCKAQEPVVAAEKGVVTAVGQGSKGDWTMMIDHDNGLQTVYAYMSAVLVKVGQQVDKGAQLGLTQDQESSRLYFELRENGQSKDPGKLMAEG